METTQLQFNFYNTIEKSGVELKALRENASKQTARVMELFTLKNMMTPEEVHSLYEKTYTPVPITSIRRAITDLTSRGWLQKTDMQKPGRWGVANYLWKLV